MARRKAERTAVETITTLSYKLKNQEGQIELPAKALLLGPNEGGKTTIINALELALCGRASQVGVWSSVAAGERIASLVRFRAPGTASAVAQSSAKAVYQWGATIQNDGRVSVRKPAKNEVLPSDTFITQWLAEALGKGGKEAKLLLFERIGRNIREVPGLEEAIAQAEAEGAPSFDGLTCAESLVALARRGKLREKATSAMVEVTPLDPSVPLDLGLSPKEEAPTPSDPPLPQSDRFEEGRQSVLIPLRALLGTGLAVDPPLPSDIAQHIQELFSHAERASLLVSLLQAMIQGLAVSWPVSWADRYRYMPRDEAQSIKDAFTSLESRLQAYTQLSHDYTALTNNYDTLSNNYTPLWVEARTLSLLQSWLAHAAAQQDVPEWVAWMVEAIRQCHISAAQEAGVSRG